MMAFILVLIGLLLVMIEFYLPGGIAGILGGIFILSGVIIFSSAAESWLAIVLFIVGTALGIWLAIYLTLKAIRNPRSPFSIYSNQDQEGYQASSFDQHAIGKKGTVLADLKPGGYIVIEGKQHPAISISGYISKGEEVIVVGGQEQSLLVKLSKKEQST